MEKQLNKFFASRHTSSVCIAVIFIYLLATMRCWIGFGGRKGIIALAFPVIMFLFYSAKLAHFKFRRRYVIFSLIVALFSIINLKQSLNIVGFVYQIVPAVGVLFILSIIDSEKEYVFAKIVKWFGVLMMISIPLYLLNLISPLPSFGTIVADYGSEELIAGDYANYFFYIRPIEVLGESSFPRFNGPFIEPGDLGCVSAFLLMGARFDFRRYKNLWVILAALFLSFSLAGYILALFGFLAKSIYEYGKGKSILFISFFAILGIYLFGTFYNDGNNCLQADEDVGFSGNNRTSLIKVEYFLMMFNNPHTLLFGYDNNTIEVLFENSLGAGFINQVIIVGLVGILGMLLPYLYFTLTSSSRRYAVLFFIFLLLYFFQRTDTLWIAIVMSYVYGIVIKERDTCFV